MIKGSNFKKIMNFFGLLIFIIIVGLPIYWLIVSSFKAPHELFSSPPKIFFRDTTLEWYIEAFRNKLVPRYFYNSFIIAFFTTIVDITIGSLASYSLARFRYRWGRIFLLALLGSYVIPPIVLLIPLYLTIQSMGLVNSYLGIVIAHTTMTLPFTIWILWSFFRSIPRSIEEAALTDGASYIGAFSRIVFPLARPAILSTGVIIFMLSWNEYLWSSVLLTRDTLKTVPVGIAHFITAFDVRWGAIMALGTAATIPIFIIFALIQKYFIKGILTGSIKG